MTALEPITPSVAGAQETLRRLELVVTRRLDGLLQGDHRGLVPGHGSEPGETRAYEPGDDVRRIDWNVTARLQLPHVRETIADHELDTWILVDSSPSLDYGTASMEKRDLVLAATAAVGFLTVRHANRLGVVMTRTGGVTILPTRTGRAHLMAALHRILTAPRSTGAHPGLAEAIAQLSSRRRRRGLAVVISDFLAPSSGASDPYGTDAWGGALRALCARHQTVAIEVVDPRELELPDVGVIELVDPESGRRREVATGSAKLRTRFAEETSRQRAAIATAIQAAGSEHLVLRTDRDWVRDIAEFVLTHGRVAHATARP